MIAIIFRALTEGAGGWLLVLANITDNKSALDEAVSRLVLATGQTSKQVRVALGLRWLDSQSARYRFWLKLAYVGVAFLFAFFLASPVTIKYGALGCIVFPLIIIISHYRENWPR